ncbi:hypothetical protein L249_8805 [Ophiocordyceps polyrhachis-furcata BCC 54312]|uniref:Cytochrome P450 n=1 Tax=Ophiocordyceps polyrhachis-furcata BCC 54312 TaxID=1330021 RepID=A0A367L233_9HYPO|nr:hypothetical protein L249_8805 [Ophiocordyceps polyrhachis-furcata BCC 54312]
MENAGVFLLLVTRAAPVLLSLLLLYVGYNLLLHPLSRYPGPFAAKLTNAYGTYFAIQKRLHLTTHQNFQKYGKHDETPDHMSLHPRATKGDSYRALRTDFKSTNILTTIDREQHSLKRKMILKVASDRSTREFESIMSSQVDRFHEQLLKSCNAGNYVNMTEQCSRLALDVVAHMAFGFPLETLAKGENRFVLECLDFITWLGNACMQLPALSPLAVLFLRIGHGNYLRAEQMIKTMIQTRQAGGNASLHDLYSAFSSSRSVAPAMASSFFYLSRNRSCYEALANEIRSTFTSASEIVSGPRLAGCKYLRACIDETLRITNPTTTLPWRVEELGEKDEDKPFIIDGHVIPRGTEVAVNLYSLFHNEEYFDDSFSYKPERWLEPEEGQTESEEQKRARQTMRKAFAPFWLGDRSCAGKTVAYLEMTLVLARTIFFFDFETAPGKAGLLGGGEAGRTDGRGRPDEFQLHDALTALTDGPNLIFHKRGDFWKSLRSAD